MVTRRDGHFKGRNQPPDRDFGGTDYTEWSVEWVDKQPIKIFVASVRGLLSRCRLRTSVPAFVCGLL
jgi:hypothetical protein